jgi:hypothetical protein
VPASCDVTRTSRPIAAPIARETRATFERGVNVWVFFPKPGVFTKTGCFVRNWVFLSAPAIGAAISADVRDFKRC